MPSTFNTVILVDDDPVTNMVQTKMVKLHHFANEVFCFSSPAAALEHLMNDPSAQSAELLFLDISMPAVNGFEFLERFEQLPGEVKNKMRVVILTSSLNQKDMDAAMAYKSVIAFINKPLDGEKLKVIELMWQQKYGDDEKPETKSLN